MAWPASTPVPGCGPAAGSPSPSTRSGRTSSTRTRASRSRYPPGDGTQDAGLFTDRDPLSGTAAPLRRLTPDARPVSALSADEPDGAHAAGESIEQAWSSPFPPSLPFMEEPWRAKPAAPLLRLLIPGLAMPARVTARGRVQVPSVRPQNDIAASC